MKIGTLKPISAASLPHRLITKTASRWRSSDWHPKGTMDKIESFRPSVYESVASQTEPERTHGERGLGHPGSVTTPISKRLLGRLRPLRQSTLRNSPEQCRCLDIRRGGAIRSDYGLLQMICGSAGHGAEARIAKRMKRAPGPPFGSPGRSFSRVL